MTIGEITISDNTVKRFSLYFGIILAFFAIASTSANFFWKYFLLRNIETISESVTKKETLGIKESVSEIRQYLQVKDPEGWKRAVEYERLMKRYGFEK